MPKVLIIESDAAVAQALTAALKARGAEAIVTGDGAEALNLARSERPDLIVLCVELSRGSGYSVCNKLKKDAELAAMPLILTSSQATEETFEQHKKLRTRAEAYVKKPYTTEEILKVAGPYIGGGGGGDLEISVDDDLAAEAGGGAGALLDVSADEESPAVSHEIAFDDADWGKTTIMRAPDFEAQQAAPKPTVKAEPKPAARPKPKPAAVDDGLEDILEPAPARTVPAPRAAPASDAEAERLRAEVRQLRQKVQKLETSIQEKELEFNDRLLEESARSREAVDLKKKLGAVEREIAKHQQAAEKAGAELERARAELDKARQDSTQAGQERQVLSDKIGQLVDKLKSLAAERDRLQAELAAAVDEKAALTAELNNGVKAREKARKAVDIALQLIAETGMVA